ncbi:winged helix-turn-helix transcriptional regulator [Acetobacter suratthaniensis]
MSETTSPTDQTADQYNVCAKNCPARMVFERLADKWTLLIIRVLRHSPCRFNQLRREIEGISQKALSQTLRKLERDGLVSRTAFPTVPVTVEYALTTLGETLSNRIAPLLSWAEDQIEHVLEAQRQYDSRQ